MSNCAELSMYGVASIGMRYWQGKAGGDQTEVDVLVGVLC